MQNIKTFYIQYYGSPLHFIYTVTPVYTQCYCKLCLFILKTCETMLDTGENSDACIKCVFLKHERLVFGLWRWCLFIVLKLCTYEFVWNVSPLFTIMFMHKNIYLHRAGKTSDLFKQNSTWSSRACTYYNTYNFCL